MFQVKSVGALAALQDFLYKVFMNPWRILKFFKWLTENVRLSNSVFFSENLFGADFQLTCHNFKIQGGKRKIEEN